MDTDFNRSPHEFCPPPDMKIGICIQCVDYGCEHKLALTPTLSPSKNSGARGTEFGAGLVCGVCSVTSGAALSLHLTTDGRG
jgi:hypothetical protein